MADLPTPAASPQSSDPSAPTDTPDPAVQPADPGPSPDVLINPVADNALEEDLCALLSLGLTLKDVERLWKATINPAELYDLGAHLLGDSARRVPIARKASIGLELARHSPQIIDLDVVTEALRSEMDEPPEHFRDPIMLTLMNDPVVLSSGHVFDRTTVFDGNNFRFQACPMTRKPIQMFAFPLVYLKAQLIDYKKKRLDSILAAVCAQLRINPSLVHVDHDSASALDEAHEAPRRTLRRLLAVASELLNGLGSSAAAAASTYQHCATTYFECCMQLTLADEYPPLLRNVADACNLCSAPKLHSLRNTLLGAMRETVARRWAAGAFERAAKLAIDGMSAALLDFEGACSWLHLLEDIAAPVALRAKADVEAWKELAPLVPCLPLLPSQMLCDDLASDAACSFWRVTIWLSAAIDKKDRAGTALVRCLLHGMLRAPAAAPAASESTEGLTSITVHGAGIAETNGTYRRSGMFQGAPRFIHEREQLWLIRYQLPSGTHWWYIADKDQLHVNDGDYYRVIANTSDLLTPPRTGWSLAQDGRPPIPLFTFETTERASSASIPAADASSTARAAAFSLITGTLRRLFRRAPDAAAPAAEPPPPHPPADAVVDAPASLTQLLADEFGEAAEALLASVRRLPAARVTHRLPHVSSSHNDHEQHRWAVIDLPEGWASTYARGVIEFMWKDQGWGNQKGHIWARVTGEIEHASVRISPHAAPHEWTQESLSLPAHWFDFSAGSARLELAYEVGAGGGHSLYLALGATLTLEPRLPELHVFDPAAAELEATASEGGELLIGDCLEVRDTHGLWSVARIVACIDDEQNGPLALVHFEGWSASSLMWLSRAFDLQHVRPLGELRGIGSLGAHTEASFRQIVRVAHEHILEGRVWTPTGGSAHQTYPFARSNTRLFVPVGRGAPLDVQLRAMQARVPFASCVQLAADTQLCAEVHRRFALHAARPT
ncbi:hypothetical protein AB1Y20_022160 [Prymnesium parvum]|uniref:U-box domain-containing protein n=1 Tax=Prymnesium parvum TaxID=97485 RepID=A0AB34JIT3_PRYPA